VQNMYVISSGTSMARRRETVTSATKALEVVLGHMRQRLPKVAVADADGDRLSYFQLKELAQSEGLKENAPRG
jgi:hypothetical protein